MQSDLEADLALEVPEPKFYFPKIVFFWLLQQFVLQQFQLHKYL